MQMKFLAIAALTLAASVAPCLSAETNMKNLDFDLSKVTRRISTTSSFPLPKPRER